MKNMILGILGVAVLLYTILTGLNVYTVQVGKNEMDRHISRIVKNVLEEEYQGTDTEVVKEILTEEIVSSLSKNGMVTVDFYAIDLEKGIISVKVTKNLKVWNGRERKIVVEKTAIVERAHNKIFNPEVS